MIAVYEGGPKSGVREPRYDLPLVIFVQAPDKKSYRGFLNNDPTLSCNVMKIKTFEYYRAYKWENNFTGEVGATYILKENSRKKRRAIKV